MVLFKLQSAVSMFETSKVSGRFRARIWAQAHDYYLFFSSTVLDWALAPALAPVEKQYELVSKIQI